MQEAALFVNVAVSLALLAILEEARDGEDENGVHAWLLLLAKGPLLSCLGAARTDHAKDGSKDVVDVDVGKVGDGGCAAAEEGGGSWAGTGVVGDKGGRGMVEVAAAGKLWRQVSVQVKQAGTTP